MFRVFLVSALFASALAFPGLSCEEFGVTFIMVNPPARTVMDVKACAGNNTLSTSLPDTETFDGVDSLEDYDAGFSATAVPSQEACYISNLEFTSMVDRVKMLKANPEVTIHSETRVNLVSMPVDDASEFGERLAEFCGDLPIYKVGKSEEENYELEAQEERTITVNFQKCCLLVFFLTTSCTTTTLTFPTSFTLTFFWLFG